MSYETTLELLGDPTRRAIVDRLRAGPATVGALAQGLPVSRPAVSKHLRLMLHAGLVRMRIQATRHFYEIDLTKIAEVRSYLDGFWEEALLSFKDRVEGDGDD